MSFDFMKLLPFIERLQDDTARLFTKFVVQAMASGDPNLYVKTALEKVMADPPKPAEPEYIDVEYKEVK